MDRGALVSTVHVHPGLSIPDLIKIVRFTFCDHEFDEVQNALMEKEKGLKLEIEEHVRDRDSLKKEIDLLEKSQSCMESQKFAAEEKLDTSKKRCDELDRVIARMEEEIRALKNENLALEEKFKGSNGKCGELAGRILIMGEMLKRFEDLENKKMVVEEKLLCSDRKCEEMSREIEELRREKLDANVTIAELKQKEIVANQTVQDLKLKNGEASQTIDELRSKVAVLDASILRIENGLSNMLSVDTEDLPNLVKGRVDACATSNENDVLPEVLATCDNSAASLGVGSSQRGGITMAHPLTVPAVAERAGTVKDNEGQPGAKGPTGKTQPAGVVIVLSDSDNEEAAVGTIPGMSSGQTSKRKRTECRKDSPTTSTAKRGKSLYGEPSRCSSFFSRCEQRASDAIYNPAYPTLSTFTVNYEDCAHSDTETCSHSHMRNYLSTSFKK